MRTQMKIFPETALERVLESLESELIEASDEEILDAAKELGQNPMMKGSIAFAGVMFTHRSLFAEFFDPHTLKRLRQRLGNEPIEAETDLPSPPKGSPPKGSN
ncbi:MAG TPA: hypothetical protein VGE96_00770 [Steroidobacteraceae bacterium]